VRPERLILLSMPSATAIGELPGGTPEWTIDDLGMALQGLEPLYFAAFAYRWAADNGSRKMLEEELLREAYKIGIREKWPKLVGGKDYVARLVDMAFKEERHPSVFRAGFMWPIIMDVSPVVWERVLSRKYEAIRGMYEAWVSIAHHHMQDRLRASEELDLLD